MGQDKHPFSLVGFFQTYLEALEGHDSWSLGATS